ncbi:MAG TPA: lamin tail domain-containing protein, partial [Herpetosiphonaceae bacterium]
TASATAPPPAPAVRLNEFRANPAPGGQEFIELHNAGGAALDLGGWRLDDAEGGGAPHAIPAGTILPSGGFWVWMIPGAYLNNSGDEVRLFDPAGRLADSAAFANAPLDRSTSRLPDGDGPWADGTPPTPGQPNQAAPPATPTATPGPSLRVALNEYLAAPPAGEREFVEVISLEPAPVDLSGWKVRDASGATRSFTATAQPGQPHALLIASGFLNNGAETITLIDPLGRPTDAISYTAAVAGRSASRLPDGDGPWADGTPPTPGQPNQAAPPQPDTAIRLNEALPRPDAGGQEFVEIVNLDAEAADLRGWKVRDAGGATRAFTLTELLPGQFHALRFGAGLLNDTGDTIELLDSGGAIVEQMSYGATRPGRSLSRLPDGVGEWVDGAPPTPDAANQPPPVARVALNEYLAQPAAGGQEFVEIVNLGAEPVDLRGWRIRDSASHTQAFTISAVPPGGFHALRFGGGLLNNDADSISLLDPEGAVLETVAYTATSLNRSASRLPDGSGAWIDGTPPTPGAANQPPAPPTPPAAARLRLNELAPHPAAGGREFAEVINLGADPVDLRGWKLRDASGATRSFTLTELPAGGIHALWFGSGFLNDGRERVELLDPAGAPVDAAEYDGVAQSFSASRLPDGVGEW